MKTHLLPCLIFAVTSATAQEPVLIGGGSTRPQPVMDYVAPPTIQHLRIRYEYEASSIPASAQPCAPQPPCAPYRVRPIHNSSYKSYPSGCSSPTVIYFGRGEASRRGYSFQHSR